MVPALVVAALLSQAAGSAKTVMLPSRVTGVADARAATLVAELATQLTALGVPLTEQPAESERRLRAAGMPPSTDCAGDRSCISRLGAVLDQPAVVAVDIGEVGGELAVHLELLDTSHSARLARSSFVLSSNPTPAELARPLKPFAAEARAALAVMKPQVKSDAPVALRTPELVPNAGAVDKDTSTQTRAVPSYALSAGGVGSAGAAGIFFAIGLSQRQAVYGERLEDGRYAPQFSRSETQARAGIYSRNFQIAAGAAVLSVALAAGAYLMWPDEP